MIKRIIMLTIAGLCAILTLVGCENGNEPELVKTEEVKQLENQEEQTIEEVVVPEVYNYNESGKIIIAMYHKFTSRE